MTQLLPDISGNGLLDALIGHNFDRRRLQLEPVTFSLKQSLYRQGDAIDFVCFPVHGMISIVSLLQDGASVEIGTIGNEGLVGLPALLGGCVSPNEVLVTGEGIGLRAIASAVRDEFDRCIAFRGAVLKFTQFFVEQVAQIAACNGRHQLEARCARWLLLIQHRLRSDEYPLTQEFLATMLGARRAGVTVAAGALQRAGIISYSHGHLTILDQTGLEAAACECHAMYKNRIEQLLGN